MGCWPRGWAAWLGRLVRCCVVPGPLVWSVDGGAPDVTAVLQVFRDPVLTGQRGRPRLRRWPDLALAQVIKHTTERRRLVGITRRVGCGRAEQVVACFGAGVINTAWIERLTGTFRARRGRWRAVGVPRRARCQPCTERPTSPAPSTISVRRMAPYPSGPSGRRLRPWPRG